MYISLGYKRNPTLITHATSSLFLLITDVTSQDSVIGRETSLGVGGPDFKSR